MTFLPGHSLETSAPVLQGRSFDAILSNAALEHVQDVDRGLVAATSMLKSGGWMFHEVDFRSHGRFEARSPLWFLTVSDPWWRRMTNRVGAPNRLRPGHFRRLFIRMGFQVHEEVVEAFSRSEARAIFPRIAETVDAQSVDDLVPAVVRYTLRRGGEA